MLLTLSMVTISLPFPEGRPWKRRGTEASPEAGPRPVQGTGTGARAEPLS